MGVLPIRYKHAESRYLFATRHCAHYMHEGLTGELSVKRNAFRAKLKAAGFESQAAFARYLKADVGTVSRWARGDREVPHAVQLLLDALAAIRKLKAAGSTRKRVKRG
jgi:hypothetical protein